MIQELVFTSAPRGLQRGKSGFCTVASTPGMAANLAKLLESLSGYRHLHPPGSEGTSANPVVYSHLRTQLGGQTLSILSRIADAGMDYSNRSNKIAHHIVLPGNPDLPGGPAHLLDREQLFHEHWELEPQTLPVRQIDGVPASPSPCSTWQDIAGDSGWAGVLIGGWHNNRPIYLIVAPDMPVLRLVSEAIDLLPARLQWQATFSTFHTRLPPRVDCLCRCVMSDSPEAAAARRNPRHLIVDLTSPLPPADNYFAEAARHGQPITGTGRSIDPRRSNIELLPAGKQGLVDHSSASCEDENSTHESAPDRGMATADTGVHMEGEMPPPQPLRKTATGRLPRPNPIPGQRESVRVRTRSLVPVLIGTNALLLVLVLVFAFIIPNWGSRKADPDGSANAAKSSKLETDRVVQAPAKAIPRDPAGPSSQEGRGLAGESGKAGRPAPAEVEPGAVDPLTQPDPGTNVPVEGDSKKADKKASQPPPSEDDTSNASDSGRPVVRLIDSVVIESEFSLPRRSGLRSVLCRFETVTRDPKLLAEGLQLSFPSDFEYRVRQSSTNPVRYDIVDSADLPIGRFEIVPSYDSKYPLALEYRGDITTGHDQLGSARLNIRAGPDFETSISLGQTTKEAIAKFALNKPLPMVPGGKPLASGGELDAARWHPDTPLAIEEQLPATEINKVRIVVRDNEILVESGSDRLPVLQISKAGSELLFRCPFDRFDFAKHGKLVEQRLADQSKDVSRQNKVQWLNEQYGAVEQERKSAGFLFQDSSKLVGRPDPLSLGDAVQLADFLTVVQLEIAKYRIPPLQQAVESRNRALRALEKKENRSDKEVKRMNALDREIEGLKKQLADIHHTRDELAELQRWWSGLEETLKAGFVLPLQTESGETWLVAVCSRLERTSTDRRMEGFLKMLQERKETTDPRGASPGKRGIGKIE